MLGTLTAAAKMKAVIAVFSLLILGGGFYELSGNQDNGIPAVNEDPYTKDIQERADLVNNAVQGIIDTQGKEEAWKYKQNCENVLSYIQREKLEADQGYMTLSTEEKETTQNYKDYLHEASFVVANYRAGETPDLTAMNEAKAKLS